LISQTSFLSGYGIAQALPGPLFSVFAYYGYQVGIGEGCALSMAAIAPSAIFLPGFLLLAGILPFWSFIYRFSKAHAVQCRSAWLISSDPLQAHLEAINAGST
jgi:chromate transporter